MSHAVVVVESPAKAKTINKYLGSDYTVLASYGHVRDLPSKDGSVEPDNDFAMHYEVDADSKKQITAIANALKGSDMLYLATDPDREGEAISWHVLEALKESKKLPKDIGVKRIVFHEITKKAVTHAIENPRDIDMDLVNAQQARRALDYLVGFTLSPVLWRKLPGSRSAGRVQSVALRLICEREAEIEVHQPREYWDISVALIGGEKSQPFRARVVEFDGEKIEKFTLQNEAMARKAEAGIKSSVFRVASITPKTTRRMPFAPFSTSTLQMEGSRKLGFGAKRTMQVAQKLYEDGFITYMRTDGVTVSADAIEQARGLISREYGPEYVPATPRVFKTKTKNAQEAHEAIRPTDLLRKASDIGYPADSEYARLYDLIWKRMMASQMEMAVYDQVAVEMQDTNHKHTLRATGSVLKFDGFLSVYQEEVEEDQKKDDDEETEPTSTQRLPALIVGEAVKTSEVEAVQHFTQPPPRYSEASLVKRLEELGIGRPSTYASIISVLGDRGYVVLEKRRFLAAPLGRIVTAFLVSFFDKYVEYNYTAGLEENLDLVADGEREWKKELEDFWKDFSARIEESKKLTITEVLDKVDALLEPYIFGVGEAAAKARVCPTCNSGRLALKTGKFGSFLGCSNYPECKYTRQLSAGGDTPSSDGANGEQVEFPKILGNHPDNGEVVSLRKGPYGVYVQLGEAEKPKRTSLPKGMQASAVDLEKAVSLLSLPREVGPHPETGDMITASIGRFGPYLFYQKTYSNLSPGDDILTIGMNRAVTVIAEAAEKRAARGERGGVSTLKELGEHPTSGEKISVLKGRYGPYIKFGKKNVTLPKGTEVESFTLEDAVALLPASGGKKKAAAKKAPAKKAASTAKKAPAKKAAPKKAAAKKTTLKKPAAKKKAAKK